MVNNVGSHAYGTEMPKITMPRCTHADHHKMPEPELSGYSYYGLAVNYTL